MKLLNHAVLADGPVVRLVGTVQSTWHAEPVELFFEYDAEFTPFINPTADPFVPALLLAAMWSREPLEIDAPVSPRLLAALPQIQDMTVCFFPKKYGYIDVSATPRPAVALGDPGKAVGCFFSLGVDSFYTLLKQAAEDQPTASSVTHIIHMEGMEQPLSQCVPADEVRQQIRAIGKVMNATLIPGRTNVRDLFNLPWAIEHFAPCLASEALSLSGHDGQGLCQVHIPGAVSYVDLGGGMGHPMIDALWSTERIELRQDGCEASRAEKIERLVGHHPLSLEHLRVCGENWGGADNCGRCQKCLRTMASLHFIGMLEAATSFPVDCMTRQHADLFRMNTSSDRMFLGDILALAARTGRDPELAGRLEALARRYDRFEAWRSVFRDSALAGLPDALKGLRQRLQRARQALSGRRAGTSPTGTETP